MSHTDDGTLHAYLDGQLSAREAVELERHVAACPECRRRLDEERALIKRAGRLLALATPPARPAPPWPVTRARPLWWRARLPLAGAAVVALVAGAAWYGVRGKAARAGPERAFLTDRMLKEQAGRRPAPAAAPLVATPLRVAPPTAVADSAALATLAARARRADSLSPLTPSGATDTLARQTPRPGALGPALPPAAGDEGGGWVEIGFDAAGAILGQPPLAVPGLRIRRLARPATRTAVVLVEQVVDSGTVIRLYEGRPAVAGLDTGRERVLGVTPPARVVQDVGPLRVAIEGPLAPDSLRRLIALLR